MSKAEYSFDEDLAHRLKNPAFKKAYDSLEPEFMFAKALLEARKKTRTDPAGARPPHRNRSGRYQQNRTWKTVCFF